MQNQFKCCPDCSLNFSTSRGRRCHKRQHNRPANPTTPQSPMFQEQNSQSSEEGCLVIDEGSNTTTTQQPATTSASLCSITLPSATSACLIKQEWPKTTPPSCLLEGQPQIEGDRLVFPFPPDNFFRCPVDSCKTEYTCQVWTSQKKSIERHLALAHKLKLASKVICIYCGETMPYRPTTHVCPNISAKHVKVPLEVPDHFIFVCPECQAAFPSNAALRSHKIIHKRVPTHERVPKFVVPISVSAIHSGDDRFASWMPSRVRTQPQKPPNPLKQPTNSYDIDFPTLQKSSPPRVANIDKPPIFESLRDIPVDIPFFAPSKTSADSVYTTPQPVYSFAGGSGAKLNLNINNFNLHTDLSPQVIKAPNRNLCDIDVSKRLKVSSSVVQTTEDHPTTKSLVQLSCYSQLQLPTSYPAQLPTPSQHLSPLNFLHQPHVVKTSQHMLQLKPNLSQGDVDVVKHQTSIHLPCRSESARGRQLPASSPPHLQPSPPRQNQPSNLSPQPLVVKTSHHIPQPNRNQCDIDVSKRPKASAFMVHAFDYPPTTKSLVHLPRYSQSGRQLPTSSRSHIQPSSPQKHQLKPIFNDKKTPESTPKRSTTSSGSAARFNITSSNPIPLSNRFEHLPVEECSLDTDPEKAPTAPRKDKPTKFPVEPFLTSMGKALAAPFNDEHWSNTVKLLDEIVSHGRLTLKIRPPCLAKRSFNSPMDAKSLQRKYRQNRKAAMRYILDKDLARCDISPDEVFSHFFPIMATPKPADTTIYPLIEGRDPLDLPPFHPREVLDRLAFVENTAPGPDGLTYKNWTQLDPSGKILASMFNLCLKARQVPPSWKTSRTILIPKEGQNPSLPASWRPISLNNTAYKVFAGLLYRRLADWMITNQALHSAQKGFMPFDGVLEHNYALRRSLELARNSGDICVAFIDIASAFPSISHTALLSALSSMGVGEHTISLIESVYTETSTAIISANSLTEPIPIRAGVKQGCPLSGLLFNAAIDPVIRNIQGSHSKIKILAYADDLVLLADSPAELVKSLDCCAELLSRVNLNINPAKCSTMHYSSTTPRGSRDTKFLLNGQPLRIIHDGEFESFLGKPVGCFLPRSTQSLDTQRDMVDKIMTSLLAPWQKNDAMKTFFYPSLNHAMRMDIHGKGQWKDLDKHILKLIKANHYLPRAATNSYVYGEMKKGALGFPQCSTDSDILIIDSAYKFLTSPDAALAKLARMDLHETVTRRINQQPTSELLGLYLSGSNDGSYENTSNAHSNTWTMARKASKRIGVTWEFKEEIPFIIKGKYRIDPLMRKKIAHNLRMESRESHTQRLINLPDQGKVIECVAAHPSSRAFIQTGQYTRFADWRFIHRARLNLLPLNAAAASKRSGKNRKCRRCGAMDETLPHVLNHCMRYSPSYTTRHNSVLEKLKGVIAGKYTVIGENTAVDSSGLRPDLVIAKGDDAIIIDSTIPFDNRLEALRKAGEEKISKYQTVAQSLRQRYKNVTIQPIVVGALGSWDPGNEKLIRLLCPNKQEAIKLRNQMVADVIHLSRNIYVHHISGIPQKD